MNAEIESECPGPLLLLGKQEESLHLLGPLLDRRWSVVRTIGEAAVEAMASILKPTAVLLEASELYLEGRAVLSRLKERSGDSRVIFLDVEGSWALLLEFESEETNDLRIQPCAVDSLRETLMGFLEKGSPGLESGADRDLEGTRPGCADAEDFPRTPSSISLHRRTRARQRHRAAMGLRR